METTEVIIARLVLGYLKKERCRTAYREFLRTSQYLIGDRDRSKFLPTRFLGLTLEDILAEYFQISRIVQGRLEATNYYNEYHSRTSLDHQLSYLLNKVQLSRMSTPCPRSPLESNLDESSPSHVDHVSDVETTPAHTLPGNLRCTSEDSYLYKKTPRRTSSSKLSKFATESCLEIIEREDVSEVLAHKLLENKEFHEKIAQTINKVAEKQYRVSAELDKTIKTVVQETEADPIFDQILEDIIASTPLIEQDGEIDTGSTTSSSAKENTDMRHKSTKIQKVSLDQSEENVNRNPKIISSTQTVEEQNDEAVRSIIANSKFKVCRNDQEIQVNNEVTVFNGSLDKYLITNKCNANTQTQPLQKPLSINTTDSLHMVPSGVTSSGSLHFDTSKQYYLSNKQSATDWSIPTLQTTDLTEQDIMAMPTVIVSDEKTNKLTTTQLLLKSPGSTKHKPNSGTLPSVFPKALAEIPSEYTHTLFNETNTQQQSGLKNVIYPKTSKKVKLDNKTQDTTESETTTEKNSATRKCPQHNSNKKHKEALNKTANTAQTNVKAINQLATPPVAERIQKTPKSGSHIRNLDFSTPPKITSTHKKPSRTKVNNNKSESSVQKEQAAKVLFSSDKSSLSEKNENSKKTTIVGSNSFKTWDADLRAAVVPVEVEKIKRYSPKKDKKIPLKKIKRKSKYRTDINNQLNTTEDNAALIEAALKTPVKLDDQCENLNCNKLDTDKTNENICEKKINLKTAADCTDSTVFQNNDKLSERNIKISNEHNANKTVLSPSKLNANKRKLINSDSGSMESADQRDKFITPEMENQNFHYPIKANRNITFPQGTSNTECLPKTPGIESPNTTMNTPFTKMLEANLKGIDISSLPTPNIPITPNFPPFTPNVEVQSPYSNRNTDYSTSSSYYQPSDNELNRSLEANVIELEKRPTTVCSDVGMKENIVSQENQLGNEEIQNCNKKVNHSIDERLKIFNGSVIGKKNLSLVKKNITPISSPSSESSNSSAAGDNVTSCIWTEKSDDTVICSKKCTETPKRTYSLRNRVTIAAATKKEEVIKISEVKEITPNKKRLNKNKKNVGQANDIVDKCVVTTESEVGPESEKPIDNQVQKEITHDVKENVSDILETSAIQRAELKKELKEKLMRTLNKIKSTEKCKSKRTSTRARKTANGKFMKIKLISNATKNKRKVEWEETNTGDNANLKGNVSSSKSKSGSKNKKSKKSTRTVKDTEKYDKSASDIEAQNLIEGLKERGILLMKNKSSPNKQTNGNSNTLENDKDPSSVTLKGDTKKNSEENHEKSTLEISTEWRETYDTVKFEEYECVVFNETKRIKKSFEDYTKMLKKTFVGKVFIEEINEEIDIPLEVSPFYSLFEIHPTKSISQKQNDRIKGDRKAEDELCNPDSAGKSETSKSNRSQQTHSASKDVLINKAISGNSREDKEVPDQGPSIKKRRVEKEVSVPEEKECKSLLQQINVDTFLNNIYGKN